MWPGQSATWPAMRQPELRTHSTRRAEKCADGRGLTITTPEATAKIRPAAASGTFTEVSMSKKRSARRRRPDVIVGDNLIAAEVTRWESSSRACTYGLQLVERHSHVGLEFLSREF